MSPRALVVCVGNPLVGDDAVGCAVHEALASRPPAPGVQLEFVAVGGLRLLDLLDAQPLLVVVDAVELGAPAGTVHVLPWEALPPPVTATTSHGVGLRETMEVGAALQPERMPGRAYLVGVEGRSFDALGAPMSPEVAAAVQGAAEEVARLLR
ncbi:MAG: hydrogenase maturation protease [Anaeromyxobacter sp.]